MNEKYMKGQKGREKEKKRARDGKWKGKEKESSQLNGWAEPIKILWSYA